jgi:O-antigen/teichoic acid export membrane protein
VTLGQRTARGAAWNYAAYGLSKGVVLVTTAVLARLLSPDDFGLVAIATIAITYIAIAQGIGLAGALIQRRADTERSANVVFTINLTLGVFLAAMTVVVAPWIAQFFGEPEATQLLRVLGLTLLIAPLGSTHLARLQRQLAFRRKLVPDVGMAVIKGAVAIPLAFAGFGPWALVIGQLAGVTAGVVLSWWAFPWMPRLIWDRALARSLLAFGIPMMAGDVVNVMTETMDYIVVGRLLGTVALGIYTVAFRIPELLVLSTVAALNRVVFPAFAAVQDDLDMLRRGFLKSVRFVSTLTVPIALGLVVTAEPAVLVVLGDSWLEVVPLVRILALDALVVVVTSTDGDVYKATGNPGLLAKLELLRTVLLLPALYLGAQSGLIGVAVALLTVTTAMTLLRIVVVSRYLDTAVTRVLTQLVPSTAAGLIMCVALIPVLFFTAEFDPIVRLAAAMATGAATYGAAAYLLDKEALLDGVRLLGIGSARPRWQP